jgi:hypothetical protein
VKLVELAQGVPATRAATADGSISHFGSAMRTPGRRLIAARPA